jgi:hypothetical protein
MRQKKHFPFLLNMINVLVGGVLGVNYLIRHIIIILPAAAGV